MKLRYYPVMLLGLITQFVSAEGVSSKLVSASTNHLELLANNLNLFMLINLEKVREESIKKNNEFLEAYFRASVDKDGKLNLYAMYEAPVALISKIKCQAKLQEHKVGLQGNDGIALLQSLSYFYLPREDAISLLKESNYSITVVAKENNELQITCS